MFSYQKKLKHIVGHVHHGSSGNGCLSREKNHECRKQKGAQPKATEETQEGSTQCGCDYGENGIHTAKVTGNSSSSNRIGNARLFIKSGLRLNSMFLTECGNNALLQFQNTPQR
jgi:hypothetical protein